MLRLLLVLVLCCTVLLPSPARAAGTAASVNLRPSDLPGLTSVFNVTRTPAQFAAANYTPLSRLVRAGILLTNDVRYTKRRETGIFSVESWVFQLRTAQQAQQAFAQTTLPQGFWHAVYGGVGEEFLEGDNEGMIPNATDYMIIFRQGAFLVTVSIGVGTSGSGVPLDNLVVIAATVAHRIQHGS